MKIDPGRLSALAEQFAFPRRGGTEGERRAADLVAGMLAEAGWNVERGEPARFVIASRASADEAPVRVVLLTTLHRPFRLWRGWLRRQGPDHDDNRTGIALLFEVARMLSAGTLQRVDVRLIFLGFWARLPWGVKTLFQDGRHKPTLVIALDRPGLGSELILNGDRRAVVFARQAAADLWLPHRVARCGRHGTVPDLAFCSIASPRGARRIEPACLAAAAQLTRELILRWAKRPGDAGNPTPKTQ